MKISLIVVGKTKEDYLVKAIEQYRDRLKHYIGFEMEIIPELKNSKTLTFEQQKEAEGELIIQKTAGSEIVWLLDERGKQFSSEEFADELNKMTLRSIRRLTFVIGGPYGFSDAVYKSAQGKISLSRMTFSHQMVRLFFVEQLYRAMTIIKGEPYHHQ